MLMKYYMNCEPLKCICIVTSVQEGHTSISMLTVTSFACVIVLLDCSLELIPISVRLLYIISQQNVLLSLKDNGQGAICTAIPSLLDQIIKTIVEQAREEERKPFFVEEESAVKQVRVFICLLSISIT